VQDKIIHVVVVIVHNCVWIFLFISINIKNSKMNQLNMFFSMIISYLCDLHLKFKILNLKNIFKLANYLLKDSIPLQPLFQNFKNLKFSWLIFSSNWLNEHVIAYIEGSMVFLLNFLKSIALFYAFLLHSFIEKCNINNC
jgi:hypothetical protein